MKFLILILSFITSVSFADPIRVAVIDTGKSAKPGIKYCETGHKDFTQTGLTDNHGHGSNVAGLITKEAGDSDFCIISIKFFSKHSNMASNMIEAIKYATDLNVDIINLSAGGVDYSREEALAIQRALNKGIKIIAAAGNDSTDFSQKCQYYPACYDERIITVGCMNANYEPCEKSNFGGKIKMVRLGESQTAAGLTMTGTSQATAIATGVYVRALNLKREKHE